MAEDDGATVDFAEVMTRVSRSLLDQEDVQHTLQGIVDLAAEHLGDEIWASVSLVRGRRPITTPASSDERAVRADHLQYELEQGPCLDAIWEHDTFAIRDFAADQRYPEWSRRVLQEVGARSSLSFQLFTAQDTLGALNLYSSSVDAFGEQDRVEGLAFACQAAIALRTAQQEEGPQSALLSRAVIGQAQGILMERYKIDADQAFAVLRVASQHSNVRLHTVAQQLVDTGLEPPERVIRPRAVRS